MINTVITALSCKYVTRNNEDDTNTWCKYAYCTAAVYSCYEQQSSYYLAVVCIYRYAASLS